jgi:glycine betaine/proline transport system ATP-binding protein
MVSDYKVQIKNLYKIFGPDPKSMVSHVQQGMGKSDLLDQHGHVLGLNDINLDIPAKKVQVVMGLSGSGKSTLIRHINRLIEPTAGEVIVDGENVLEMNETALRNFRQKKASMVFQKFALMPHRTIAENAAYGLTVQNIPEDEAKERSQRWIDRVGLSGFENHYPAQLSGGMQQRVGLARALATDAEILLMDEAFSALDPLIRTDMQSVMLDLQEELHKTIIFITHDLDEALRIGDNIAILRDGRMVQAGTPQEIVLKPADDYVRDFIQDINRARVLQVGSMAHGKPPAKGPKIEKNVVVEEALQIISSAKAKTAIVTDKGKPVGSVTLDDMIAAIARPEPGDKGIETYR